MAFFGHFSSKKARSHKENGTILTNFSMVVDKFKIKCYNIGVIMTYFTLKDVLSLTTVSQMAGLWRRAMRGSRISSCAVERVGCLL